MQGVTGATIPRFMNVDVPEGLAAQATSIINIYLENGGDIENILNFFNVYMQNYVVNYLIDGHLTLFGTLPNLPFDYGYEVVETLSMGNIVVEVL